MDLASVMTKDVVTVSPDTSVLNARRLLSRHGIRHLPVLDGGRLVGMVSDRDVRIHDQRIVAALTALESDLVFGRYRRVATLMTAPVRTVSPRTTMRKAAAILARERIGALPVVDDGRLVGIVSVTDLLAHVAELPADPVGELARTGMRPMPPGDERPGRPPERLVA